MKKIIFCLVAALLPLSVLNVYADENTEVSKKIPLKMKDGNSNFNRSLTQIPIESTYFGMMNMIQTVVSSDLGLVNIEVTNTATGEFWSDSFDSEISPISTLSISGTSGLYLVTYTTDDGNLYEGDFTIN